MTLTSGARGLGAGPSHGPPRNQIRKGSCSRNVAHVHPRSSATNVYGTRCDEEVSVTIDNRSTVVQEFFQKCFQGDLSSAVELLDPNVTYRVPGSHRLAGTFEGPKAVTGHLEQLLIETHHTVDVLQWEDWMIGVNNLAALVDLRAQRHGAIDTVRAIFLVAMSKDDKVRRIEVFFSDQAMVERFFV